MKIKRYTDTDLDNMSKEELKEQYRKLQEFNEHCVEAINNMNRKNFVSKSEKISSEQLSFFNEIEQIAEEAKISVKGYTKEIKAKKQKQENFSGIEVKETIYHKIETPVCPECGSSMIEIGTETKEEIVYKPAEVYKIAHVYSVYKCERCYDEDMAFEKVVAENAALPRIIEGSIVSASLISGIAYNKFVLDVPLYRQEKDFKLRNISISRQTMCNWLIRCSCDYLEKIYNKMKEDIDQLSIIHMDETTLKVIEEKKKQKNYIWMAVSGKWEKKQIAIYHYNKDRTHETVGEILTANSNRYIHSDGYGAYHDEKYGKNIGCLAHVRRRFFDALETSPIHSQISNEKDTEKRKELLDANPSYKNIYRVLEIIRQLYQVEAKAKEKQYTPEQIYELRQKESVDKFRQLFDFIYEIKEDYSSQSIMSKAINYALGQKEYCERYLTDGRFEIDDNRGERQIKPFVMARKNFLFANTINGAKISAIYFSLIESSKLNNLDPYLYLKYVLEESASNMNIDINNLLPYSDSLPKEIKTAPNRQN